MRENIPLFPLSNGLFPEGMLSLQIFEVRYLDLIKRCHKQQQPFGVAWIKEGSEVQVPGQEPSLHIIGCMAHIRELKQVQPNLFRVLCQGGLRFRLHDVEAGPYGVWQGSVTYLQPDPETEVPATMQAHADRLGTVIASAQQHGVRDKLPIFPPYKLDQCGWLANRYAEAIPVDTETKLKFLSELDPLQRLRSVIKCMQESSSEE
jgi:Lon protease-like protein